MTLTGISISVTVLNMLQYQQDLVSLQRFLFITTAQWVHFCFRCIHAGVWLIWLFHGCIVVVCQGTRRPPHPSSLQLFGAARCYSELIPHMRTTIFGLRNTSAESNGWRQWDYFFGWDKKRMKTNRDRKQNRALLLSGCLLNAAHMPAGNLSLSMTLRAYHRTIITYANSTEREREREREKEWAQRWSKHISGGNLPPPKGGQFTLPKALTSNPILSNTACNHAGKQALALFVWWDCASHFFHIYLVSCFSSLSPPFHGALAVLHFPQPHCPFQSSFLLTFFLIQSHCGRI